MIFTVTVGAPKVNNKVKCSAKWCPKYVNNTLVIRVPFVVEIPLCSDHIWANIAFDLGTKHDE